ncbi:hypothetical protein GT347_02025 [Xylophilus rhododendri]|uniref:Uncharacterized protein n=1 Tax=Xylophilus rhododendri TaxID=2697032 RepID=A0A857J1Y0_9BURK|nr:hypothetical protein [Xylophilus rhododendri]QHI96875.1 hypothetical protein GT347_02025 [Xylophilus rhododendri]
MHLPSPLRLIAALAAGLLACQLAFAQTPAAADADSLRQRYDSLGDALRNNPFGRPLALESSENKDQLAGNIYAVLDRPFAAVSTALQSPANWCEVLMLHLNTKYCAPQPAGGGTSLAVSVGRKFDQPLEQAQKVAFVFNLATASDRLLDVRLSAQDGPLSTHDYRIGLQAIPLAGGKTFIHLGYSYAYGTAARLAMQAYLGTLGRDKTGFTSGGIRGVVERNTMRYYLAIDSFLAAPSSAQREARAASWFDATEQYAKQLHEVERDDYLAMKRKEYARLQQTPP